MKKFVFGWVASNINSNFESWSSWKAFGSEADSQKFWRETVDEAESLMLTWFCNEVY